MTTQRRITILADNAVADPALLGEHGFSALVEANGARVLFDTGQGRVLLPNTEALGIPLADLDGVVLSHGHFDHTGGLAEVVRLANPPVFLHPAALDPKFSRERRGGVRPIGIPEASARAIDPQKAVWTKSATEVVPGIRCAGEIPRTETVRAEFFADRACTVPDPLPDDQALFFETPRGLVVLFGCGHAGLRNTLDHVAALSGHTGIFAVVGGFHLYRATPEELEAAGEAIRKHDVQMIAPCHCTGASAQAYLRARFGPKVRDAGAGTVIEFS